MWHKNQVFSSIASSGALYDDHVRIPRSCQTWIFLRGWIAEKDCFNSALYTTLKQSQTGGKMSWFPLRTLFAIELKSFLPLCGSLSHCNTWLQRFGNLPKRFLKETMTLWSLQNHERSNVKKLWEDRPRCDTGSWDSLPHSIPKAIRSFMETPEGKRAKVEAEASLWHWWTATPHWLFSIERMNIFPQL